MKGFVYFLPEKTGNVSRSDFMAAGLTHALTVGNPSSRSTSAGPEGLGGMLAVPTHPHAAPALYEPAKQIWQAGPGKKYFVGYYTDDPPGPAALARDRLVPGESLQLGDGNNWTIPIAVSFVQGRGSTLPRRFIIGADGETWEAAVMPEYMLLCRHAEAIVQAFLAASESSDGMVQVSMDVAQSLQMCVDALGCNYRVGPVETSLLGLINTETRWEILRALIDDVARQRVESTGEKKTDNPDTSAT